MTGKNLKDLERSKTLLNAIIEKESDYAPAYLEMAKLYIILESEKNNKITNEIKRLEYLSEHSSSNKKDDFMKKIQDQNEKLKESKKQSNIVKNINKSLDIEPTYADAYTLLGYNYYLDNDYKSAIASLDKAVDLGGKSPWINLNYSMIYKDMGRKELMFEKCEKVFNTYTDDKRAKITALTCLKNYYFEKANMNIQLEDKYKKELDDHQISFVNNKLKNVVTDFEEGKYENVQTEIAKILSYELITREQIIWLIGQNISSHYAKWATYVSKNGEDNKSHILFSIAKTALESGNKKLLSLKIDLILNESFVKNNIISFKNHDKLGVVFENKGTVDLLDE